MIKNVRRFDAYAYRVADRNLASRVTEVEEGQWVTINTDGELVISDGTQRSFLAIGSMRDGRNQVAGKGIRKIAYLVGSVEVEVTNYDATGDYATLGVTPLVVDENGDLRPFDLAGGDTVDMIVADAIGDAADGYLRVCTRY